MVPEPIRLEVKKNRFGVSAAEQNQSCDELYEVRCRVSKKNPEHSNTQPKILDSDDRPFNTQLFDHFVLNILMVSAACSISTQVSNSGRS